jgi:hypothetical protein
VLRDPRAGRSGHVAYSVRSSVILREGEVSILKYVRASTEHTKVLAYTHIRNVYIYNFSMHHLGFIYIYVI